MDVSGAVGMLARAIDKNVPCDDADVDVRVQTSARSVEEVIIRIQEYSVCSLRTNLGFHHRPHSLLVSASGNRDLDLENPRFTCHCLIWPLGTRSLFLRLRLLRILDDSSYSTLGSVCVALLPISQPNPRICGCRDHV